MSSLHTATATLPKGFRYQGHSSPRTPEPLAQCDEAEAPAPPRPRLRLKRRQASQLHAPTQQFLASVAAADVPVPSVEASDLEMVDNLPEVHVQDLDDIDIYQHLHHRTFSPPKTPVRELTPSVAPFKYPDWSLDSVWSCSGLDSSPEYESSRPSTAFSTQTSSSLFSQYSYASEDGSFISPDPDANELFKLDDSRSEAHTMAHIKPRKAPWTKAMSSHLWATYLLYMSDPRVTPVHLGRSSIPPNGVCMRVAREAQRSWKGSKSQLAAKPNSGSSTPTPETSKVYMQWPHTGAATRAHLRELCKLKATSRPGCHMPKSPAPYCKTADRRWNRRSTPARSPSVFSAHDMAFSLTLSTSLSMQPNGPLAQLTDSKCELEPFPDLGSQPGSEAEIEPPTAAEFLREPKTPDRARLGSPFLAKSYGPSSSSSLDDIQIPRQSQTLGPRKLLKSPVRLGRSCSGTQKRRSVKGLEDQPRKRPSLSATFWREGSVKEFSPERSRARGAQARSNSMSNVFDDHVFEPSMPTRIATGTREAGSYMIPPPSSLPQSVDAPRLGSPFPGHRSSHSVPNRLSAPHGLNLTAFRRPFATVQEQSQSGMDVPLPPRSSLVSRLAYLDQRLKELRSRGDRRQSQSPL
ncbi:hypothetical protein F4780DRAFT_335983 [Xylariomycetidae sp. FL0641]|nr:hypothetical protein F4780DRAFT_335983 [Xylariomycetidae sp. FL0641]